MLPSVSARSLPWQIPGPHTPHKPRPWKHVATSTQEPHNTCCLCFTSKPLFFFNLFFFLVSSVHLVVSLTSPLSLCTGGERASDKLLSRSLPSKWKPWRTLKDFLFTRLPPMELGIFFFFPSVFRFGGCRGFKRLLRLRRKSDYGLLVSLLFRLLEQVRLDLHIICIICFSPSPNRGCCCHP